MDINPLLDHEEIVIEIPFHIPPPPSRMDASLKTILSSKGGLFYLDNEQKTDTYLSFINFYIRHKSITDQVQRLWYDANPREISFGLFSDGKLSAFSYASPRSDKNPFDFVGVSYGSSYVLGNLYGRLLAHPDVFSDFGDAQNESALNETFDFIPSSTDNFAFDLILPKCPLRSKLAITFKNLAHDFLFFHELTHLRNGHLEFVNEKFGHKSTSSTLEALGELTGKDGMIFQTLEIDADCGAISTLLNTWIEAMATKHESSDESPHGLATREYAYGNIESLIFNLNYVLYLLFRFLGDGPWMSEIQENWLHPFPQIRAVSVGNIIIANLEKKNLGLDPKDIAKIITSSTFKAEQDLALITNTKPNYTLLTSVIRNPDQNLYLESFERNWSAIRPELEKYKRGGNLAPAKY